MNATGNRRVVLFSFASLVWGLAAVQERGPRSLLPGQQSAIEHTLVATAPYRSLADPDLAVDDRGRVRAAYLGLCEGGDQVLVSDLYPRRTDPVPLTAEAGEFFPPRIAASGEATHVVWAQLRPGGAELWWSRSRDEEWSAPERMDGGLGGSSPSITADGKGGCWVAWTAFRGEQQDVLARHYGSEEWGQVIDVTEHESADVQPAIAVDPDGNPWVAWSTWRDGDYASANYEVYARRLGPELGAPLCVSRSTGPDHYPEWIRTESDLGLAWTTSTQVTVELEELVGKSYDAWSDRRHVVAWLEPSGWGEPEELGPAAGAGEALDQLQALPGLDDREVWLLYHDGVSTRVGTKNPRYLRLRRWRPDGTAAKLDLSWKVQGAARRVGAAWEGGRLWTIEAVQDGHSRFPAGSLRALAVLGSEMQPRRWSNRRAEETEPTPDVPDLSRAGERASAPTREGADPLYAYFGNLHAHTDISVDGRLGDGPPGLNLLALRDVAGLDFVCLTDHTGDITPNQVRELWRSVELWNRPGRFVTLHGCEWSSSIHGHKNIVFADTEVQMVKPLGTPDDLWDRLESGRALTIPHHVSHGRPKPTNWSFHNDEIQRLVEVFQRRGNYEYDGAPLQRRKMGNWRFTDGHSVQAALDAGHHLGLIASPDHGGGLGLAGVWAAELDRASVFEALHARRTFGTTGAKMTLWLEVDGQPQGGSLAETTGPLDVRGVVRGTGALRRLVLVSNGKEVAEARSDSPDGLIEWTFEPEPGTESWLYLRAEQADGHIGWTSPVWVE
jgi:hypothetical protein